MSLQVDLEPPPRMVATEAELLKGVLTGHLVRMLRVAPHLQMLDFTTFAIQVLTNHLLRPSVVTTLDHHVTLDLTLSLELILTISTLQ